LHILDTVESGLTEPLKSLSIGQRRQLFGRVCKTASEFIRDIEPELAELVGQCEKAKELSSSQIAAVRLAAKWADERYFDLKENNVDETVWMNWFVNARLASAIYASARDDSWESSADALYELSVIFDDSSTFLTVLKNTIGMVR
jgi:methionine salvage enolase-phosphatase E1